MPEIAPPEASEPAGDNPILNLIPRYHRVFFALAVVLVIVAFNGQWRVGRDSAAYRGLGHQLATTGKYVFREKSNGTVYTDQQDLRYPGMPIFLAAVEKVFGPGAAAPVTFIMLMGLVTLALTWALCRSNLPPWLAITATVGVGLNARFLTHAHEILSDVPFLFGVALTLLAFDRLLRAATARRRAAWVIVLVLGLSVAAAMRPTFWLLAIALLGASAWGLFRPLQRCGEPGQAPHDPRSRRIACGLTLAMLVVSAGAFLWVIDLRGRSAGGYEQKLTARLSDMGKTLRQLPVNVTEMFEQTLPETFFGTQLGSGLPIFGPEHKVGLGSLASLVLIGACAWLVRRNVLWGLLATATMVAMAVIGSVPRYFIMILPLMLIAWGDIVQAAARRVARWKWAPEVVTAAGLGLVLLPNLVHCADLVREQHGVLRPNQGLKHVGFLKAYHKGQWAGIYDVADMVRRHVRADQKVIGPEATVLTYLSDRHVFGLGMLLPRKDTGGLWTRKIRQMAFHYAIFPDGDTRLEKGLYKDKDQITARLIRLGVLRPTRTVASAGGYKLCEFQVVDAPSKSKRLSTKNRAAATQPSTKRSKRRRAAATMPGTAPTTLPATAPTTIPATTPIGGKDGTNRATPPATGGSVQGARSGGALPVCWECASSVVVFARRGRSASPPQALPAVAAKSAQCISCDYGLNRGTAVHCAARGIACT